MMELDLNYCAFVRNKSTPCLKVADEWLCAPKLCQAMTKAYDRSGRTG